MSVAILIAGAVLYWRLPRVLGARATAVPAPAADA
jgi:hypothetical protein